MSAAVDTSTLTSREEIDAKLQALEFKESHVDQQLSELISQRSEIDAELEALYKLHTISRGLKGETQAMWQHVEAVSITAERVGRIVRDLDDEQQKVKECIDVIQAVQELKSSFSQLNQAIQKQDWESATRHYQRVVSVDSAVVTSGFAEAVVPSVELPDIPKNTLESLKNQLLTQFLTAFKSATAANDNTNINRFFKLFPLINEEQTGLDVYSEWVGNAIKQRASLLATKGTAPTHYANLLTLLFENLALVISQHQPVVAKYYGAGKMRQVAQKLLSYADDLGVAVIDNWREERHVQLKVLHATENNPDLDAKEIDALLTEISLMSCRWQLLRRFLYDQLGSDEDLSVEDEAARNAFIEDSSLARALKTQLENVYMPLETWYLNSRVQHAHSMDEIDRTSSPLVATSLDDAFYVIKKIFYRSASTSLASNTLALTEFLKTCVEKDVLHVWRYKIDSALKDIANTANAFVSGEGRISSVAYLNNLDTGTEYLSRLVSDLVEGGTLDEYFFVDTEIEAVTEAITDTSKYLENRFKSTIRLGLENLLNIAIRPKLRNLMGEVYRDVTYQLTEDEYIDAEFRNDVPKRFTQQWEALISDYSKTMTPGNFSLFFSSIVAVLVRIWESIVRDKRYSETGALLLDKHIRSIFSYLSSQSSFSTGSLRDSFSRLNQISTLLTLESLAEADDILDAVATSSRLSQDETQFIWNLRT